MKFILPLRSFKYIFFQLLWPFLLSLTAFFSLVFVSQFINKADFFFQDQSMLSHMTQYFSLMSLSYLPLTLPFCLLFGVLFGYGRLSFSLELTAMANLVYSKLQLSQPALVLGFVCLLICNQSIHHWGPQAKLLSKSLHQLLAKKAALSHFQPGVFLSQFPGTLLYAEDEKNKTLNRVFLIQKQSPSETQVIFSQHGQIIQGQDQNVQLKLSKGQIYSHIGTSSEKQNLVSK